MSRNYNASVQCREADEALINRDAVALKRHLSRNDKGERFKHAIHAKNE